VPLRLDRIPDQRRDIGAAEILDRADADGGDNVDLGEETSITSMPTKMTLCSLRYMLDSLFSERTAEW
jgi:hypothetical protein